MRIRIKCVSEVYVFREVVYYNIRSVIYVVIIFKGNYRRWEDLMLCFLGWFDFV